MNIESFLKKPGGFMPQGFHIVPWGHNITFAKPKKKSDACNPPVSCEDSPKFRPPGKPIRDNTTRP